MAASGSSWTYLGVQDACFHPGHPLVLPEELDLADFAELGQHSGEVCLQINDMADAMARPHQEGGGWLFLVLCGRRCQSETEGQRQALGSGWGPVTALSPPSHASITVPVPQC